jgi:6-phosphogluconolactonase (cycloisomerase 2 family)
MAKFVSIAGRGGWPRLLEGLAPVWALMLALALGGCNCGCGSSGGSGSASAAGYTIGGTLSGLAAGQSLTLLDNGTDSLALLANGAFSFATPIAQGGAYSITVGSQPVGQTCTLSNASGSGLSADVSNISVVCQNSAFTVGGTLSGLASGAQLTLQDNGGPALTLGANGSFTFAQLLAPDSNYLVTVSSQPLNGQPCSVNRGVGYAITSNVSDVAVVCQLPGYTVGGTLSGLSSGSSVTLTDNGGDALTLTGNGAFSFGSKVASGASYTIRVQTQPTGQVCTVSAGTGTSATPDTSTVACTATTYTVSGTLSGLASGQQLTLLDNEGDPLTLTGNGSFTFPTPVAAGSAYMVTVGTQPSAQSCEVTAGAGSAVQANVSGVSVLCQAIDHLYAVDYYGNQVLEYGIGIGGELTPLSPASVPTQVQPTFIVTDPVAYYAYVANAQSGTISQYAITSNGTLTPLSPSAVTTVTNPDYLSIDPQGRYLYASGTSSADIAEYAIGSNGTLTPMSPAAFTTSGVDEVIGISPTGGNLYAADSTNSVMYQFSIGSGGLLGLMTPASVGGVGILPGDVEVDPTDRYVYTANQHSGDITAYAVGSGGALSVMPSSPVATASTPTALVIDSTGRRLYVACRGANEIQEFAIGGAGVLSPLSFPAVATLAQPVGMVIDPTGSYLYAADYYGQAISEYSIGSGGGLSPLPTPSVAAGSYPVSLAVK